MQNSFHPSSGAALRGSGTARCCLALVAFAIAIGSLYQVCSSQIMPSLKIKLNVVPSVAVSAMDEATQSAMMDGLQHLLHGVAGSASAAETTLVGAGLSISAYENITVRVTVTQVQGDDRIGVPRFRITCGFLNDGTVQFGRATITDSSAVQFRLRKRALLKESMPQTDPLFTAHAFILLNLRKEVKGRDSPRPVATVTVETL